MAKVARFGKIAGITAIGVLVLAALALGTAPFVLQGERLGALAPRFTSGLRGKITFKSARWQPRLYADLLTNSPTPVVVEGLKITDPEGTTVLDVPHLEVKVPLRSAAGGDIYLHDLVVGPNSFWKFGQMKKSEDIGFLAALESRKRSDDQPMQPKALPKDKPLQEAVFKIVNAELQGLTALFDFPGAWGLELRDIKAPATLTVQGDFVGWDIQGLDARGGGYLQILTELLPFDRVLVKRVATTRERPDDIYLDVEAARTRRSTLTAKGFFTGIYRETSVPGIDMHAEFDDAADALSAVASAHQIPGLRIEGKRARVVLDVKEAFAAMKIAAAVSGLDVRFGQHAARGLGLKAKVDLAEPMKLTIDELGFGAPGGGRFRLSASMDGPRVKARPRFDRFSTESYLPRDLRALAGGKLDGGFTLAGDLDKKELSISGLNLGLVRTRAGGLPARFRVRGEASASPTHVSTSGIVVEAPGASAQVKGNIDLGKKLLALVLRASTTDLPALLESLGLPPIARGAALSVDVGGTPERPRARGEAVLQGIAYGTFPEIPELRTNFRLERGTLHIDQVAAAAFGGTVEGSGEVQLYRDTVDRMLRQPMVKFQLRGQEIELGTLLSYSVASGRISFTATAEGPADKLRAHLKVPAGATLELLGEEWELGGLDVEVDQQSVSVKTARISRRSGASVDLEGTMAFGTRAGPGPMAWRLKIRDVALEALPGIATAGVPISGRLFAELEVSGTVSQPQLAGSIDLRKVSARGASLGDGRIVLASDGQRGLSVKGDLFGRFHLEGTANFAGSSPRVSAALSFEKLVLEDLLPELRELGDGRGVVSGRISVDLQPDRPLAIEARLTELGVSVTRMVVGPTGAQVPQAVWVRNAGDLRAVVIGERIVLAPARLVTDGGEFKIEGELDGESLRGALSGHVDLDLLQPFIRERVDRLTGELGVALKVGGTRRRPTLDGSLAIAQPVRILPAGIATEVVIPAGVVKLGTNSVELADLAVTVAGSTLTLRGRARYDERFRPTAIEMNLGGEVSARLLEILAPGSVSEASGSARVSAQLSGTASAPDLRARIDVGQIALTLRDVGRRVAIESGTVELTPRELIVRDMNVQIDDQGRLLIGAAGVRPARVQILKLYPTLEIGTVDIPLRGERLTYVDPELLEIDDISLTAAVSGSARQGLKAVGDIRLVSGRLVQDFSVRDLVISPRINESSSSAPFWEGVPLLEKMALDLRVRTVGDSFVIQNNLAPEIHVIVDLHVGGTLPAPRLAGNIRPTDGRFHIPGIRDDFDLVANVNHITFVPTKSIANGETPELNLEAENLVTDSFGNEHNVRMRISGPVGQAAIDLSTDSGLDRNQTFLLLVTGRTNEDASRAGARNPTLGTNMRTATDVVGQLTRDTVANLVEPYIDDTLQLLTGRKLNLRPTVGADGFELSFGLRASRQINVDFSFLRGFQNQRRYRGEANLWLVDYLTLRGFGERLTLTPQQGLSDDIDSLNLELSLEFPIRFRRPR